MYYDINYKRKSDHVIKHWKYIDKNQLDSAIRQLKYMATTFKGDIVLGVQDLDYIQIEERNYAYFAGGNYYFKTKEYHPETGAPIDGFVSSDELQAMGYEDEDIVSYYEKDVTNEILYKYEICGDDYLKIGKVLFADNVITANAFSFKLEEGKKIQELFDLIFRAKEFYKKLSFTYDELKFVYKNSGVKYKELEPYLNKQYIDDTLGKKVREIRKKTGMKNKIIENNNGVVSIRQEAALWETLYGQDITK